MSIKIQKGQRVYTVSLEAFLKMLYRHNPVKDPQLTVERFPAKETDGDMKKAA